MGIVLFRTAALAQSPREMDRGGRRDDDRNMHRALLAYASLIAATFAPIAIATGLPWEIWESPTRLATYDPTDVVLERSSHCLDGCRYDRSNRGPEDPADNPYPLRWLYRDGSEAIVFDERGPGAVTRIWMTTGFGASSCFDPAIRVRFYFDGAPAPSLDMPLAALFDGSTPPFTPPLVADNATSSGGYVSYVPIAYASALRIALVGADNGGTNPCTGNDERLLWFQLQHHRLAPGTPVASFAPGDDFPAWRAFLAHAGDDPWNGMIAPIESARRSRRARRSISARSRVPAGCAASACICRERLTRRFGSGSCSTRAYPPMCRSRISSRHTTTPRFPRAVCSPAKTRAVGCMPGCRCRSANRRTSSSSPTRRCRRPSPSTLR